MWNLVKIVKVLLVLVGLVWFGRGYVMNVGRGCVIQHSQWATKVGIELLGQLKIWVSNGHLPINVKHKVLNGKILVCGFHQGRQCNGRQIARFVAPFSCKSSPCNFFLMLILLNFPALYNVLNIWTKNKKKLPKILPITSFWI